MTAAERGADGCVVSLLAAAHGLRMRAFGRHVLIACHGIPNGWHGWWRTRATLVMQFGDGDAAAAEQRVGLPTR